MNITGKGGLSALVDLAGEQASGPRPGQDALRKASAADTPEAAEQRAALEQAATQFEAVFLNTLMKAMRQTVPQNDLFNGGGATKFYRQMHDAEMAKSLATSNGGLGIADMIVRQLTVEGATDDPTVRELPAQGPPAPGVMERYRLAEPVGPDLAARRRLARFAAAQGAAVADTLRKFQPEIESAARGSGLDPALVLAVVMEESGGDPAARSAKGARGLMQLMPATARELGVGNPEHPAQNLHGGARYLAAMLEKFSGDLEVALAAYNAGPGTVERLGGKVPDYPETRRYVKRVMERFQGLAGGTQMASDDR
jgi:soluble lytic murein transglycosylase-like protein